MSRSSSTNYRETSFRYEDLTKIHGEPSFHSLKILNREIKANARSVYSNLGGANHGHLGLVCSDAEYATISPIPFVRPVFPEEPLNIPAGTTRIVADNLERDYKEAVRVFREVMGVENALKQQLIKAVDPTYLDAIRDHITYDLIGDLQENLHFLLTTYGKVTPETLAEEYEKVIATTYNSSLPIDTIFNSVRDLSELANAANVPYSAQQQISILYTILNRSGQFKQDIKEWKRKPAAQKTMLNFTTHFRRAHEELRETTNETLEALQHANIARQVIDGIQHLLPSSEDTTPPTEQEEAPPATPAQQEPPPAQMCFSATGDNTLIPSLLQQMTTMQTMMMNMQNEMNTRSNGQNRGGGGRGGRGGGRGQGRGRGQGVRFRNPAHHTHYCWSHGACKHSSADCQTPAEGHKREATFENKLGGSTRNVL